MVAVKLKNLILKFVNAPEENVLSSQTLYESLFYCLNRGADDFEWFKEATFVSNVIIETQLRDGGFDIGYDFIFGDGLRKTYPKEGTAPEMLSVTALCEYLNQYGDVIPHENQLILKRAINLGVDWILKHLIKTPAGAAIPYAPLTFHGVHITNASSFCISALATSLRFLESEKRITAEGALIEMYRFMKAELSSAEKGSYWTYFYQSEPDFCKNNGKIDNYHIAQQLYHHCLAQKHYPHVDNYEIIRDVLSYLKSISSEDGFVPYTILNGKCSDKVDLWGFSSLISAFMLSGEVVGDSDAEKLAGRVASYIFEYCRAKDDHFYAILLNSSKGAYDSNFYPRSDAWVIHGLSCLSTKSNDYRYMTDFCDSVYFKIKASRFRGLENHTLTWRKQIFSKLVNGLRRYL